MDEKPTITLKQGHRSISPVHIHLTDTTPLHVHVKKPPRPTNPNLLPIKSCLKKESRLFDKIQQQHNDNVKLLKNKLSYQHARKSSLKNSQSSQTNNKVTRRAQSLSSQYKLNHLKQSEQMLRDKEKQLGEYEKKLMATEVENKKMLDNIESICNVLENSNVPDKYPDHGLEPDINKLGKSQLYLQTLALKVDDFLTLLRNIRKDTILDPSSMSEVEINHLMTQKKILERDLIGFDNEVFAFIRREMIRLVEERSKFIEVKVERDDLFEKFQRLNKSYEMLQDEFKKTNQDTKNLLVEMEAVKAEQLQNSNIMETLRQTKAHLQRELTNKESENSRLTSKINTLESMLNTERSLNQELKGKVNLDKENLKKAARLHKSRADKSESTLEKVENSLMEKNVEMEKMSEQMNNLKLQMSKIAREKMVVTAELNDLKNDRQRRKSFGDGEDGDNNDENGSKKLKEIKKALRKAEESLKENENESDRLKVKLGNSENIIEEYKNQLSRQKREIEELRQEVLKARLDKDAEYNKLLKDVELMEQNKNRHRQHDTINDNQELVDKIMNLERKLNILEDENKELAVMNAKREETLKQTNLRLEEKINEGLMMQRQLDNMMMEARKMKDHESNKTSSADRVNQVQMLEMEGQLNQLRHEVSKLRREKEEAERRFNQRTLDMKDRLEQSCSTNRTLQNYIHFLKNSYACAFNDTPHITSLSRVPDLTSRDFLSGDYVGNIGNGGNVY